MRKLVEFTGIRLIYSWHGIFAQKIVMVETLLSPVRFKNVHY